MSWNEWFVLQFGQRVGSVMRPLSISEVDVFLQTVHWKNPSRISGMRDEVLMTIPLIVISWSISETKKSVNQFNSTVFPSFFLNVICNSHTWSEMVAPLGFLQNCGSTAGMVYQFSTFQLTVANSIAGRTHIILYSKDNVNWYQADSSPNHVDIYCKVSNFLRQGGNNIVFHQT